MKALKQALAVKQATKKAQDNAQSKKIAKKMSAAAKAAGQHIVDVAKEVHKGLRTALMEQKGKSGAELELIGAEVKDGLKKWADSIKASEAHATKDELHRVKVQSIYNMVSDIKAVLNAYAKYADLSKEQRKQFDSREKDATRYASYVAFCRHFNRGNKAAPAKGKPTAARQWKKGKAQDTMTRLMFTLRAAPLANLLKLQDFIEKQIERAKQGAEGNAQARKSLRKAA